MFALQQFVVIHVLTFLGQNVLGSEIINGTIAPDKEMLHMASLIDFCGHHVCGGFLVAENFVMTAAHCDGPGLSVVLGTHNLKKADKIVREIERTYKHPSYKDVNSGYDIMILKLRKPVQQSKRIKIIELPDGEMTLKENVECQVAGWGRNDTCGDVVDDLRVVNVSVISPQVCWKEWGYLPARVICAGGYNTAKGACWGDSGGPLVCKGKAVGVVSYGRAIGSKAVCDYPDRPNVYTDISKYLFWIRSVLKGKES